jgi:hypothetical protein
MLGTRRDFLAVCSSIFSFLSPDKHPQIKWYEKHPPEWTPEDISLILSQSAWAKKGTLESIPDAIKPDKKGRRSPVADGIRDKRIIAGFDVLVRWESGLPVRLARKRPPPPGDGTPDYVLGMSRLPMPLLMAVFNNGASGGEAKQPLNNIDLANDISKHSFLERDGKEPIPAEHAEWADSDFGSSLLVSFSREHQPIELADRVVSFKSQIGSLIVRTEFQLRPMIFKGRLEL